MRIEGRGEEYGVLHFKITEEAKLGALLVMILGVDLERVAELAWLGACYLNQKRVFELDQKVKPGDLLRLHTVPRRFPTPDDLLARIVSVHADFLIVDKPSGFPVHALTDNCRENLISVLEKALGLPLYITHRLDIETSGLLILAKNPVAQHRLNVAISEKKVRRFYRAIVEMPLKEQLYVHYMRPSPKAPKQVIAEERKGWQKCEMTIARCVPALEGHCLEMLHSRVDTGAVYLLEIELHTGRTQQIRAQLAASGAPILGDTSYGGRPLHCGEVTKNRSIALRAFSLEFEEWKVEI